jgi:hypothetical protein
VDQVKSRSATPTPFAIEQNAKARSTSGASASIPQFTKTRLNSRSPRRQLQGNDETPTPYVGPKPKSPSPTRAPSEEIGTVREKSLTFRSPSASRVVPRSSLIAANSGRHRSTPYDLPQVPILRPERVPSRPPRTQSVSSAVSVGEEGSRSRAGSEDYAHGFTPSKQFKLGNGKGVRTANQRTGRRARRTMYNYAES